VRQTLKVMSHRPLLLNTTRIERYGGFAILMRPNATIFSFVAS